MKYGRIYSYGYYKTVAFMNFAVLITFSASEAAIATQLHRKFAKYNLPIVALCLMAIISSKAVLTTFTPWRYKARPGAKPKSFSCTQLFPSTCTNSSFFRRKQKYTFFPLSQEASVTEQNSLSPSTGLSSIGNGKSQRF
jgi:hypothetical protein